jgi:putative transcriptional regulator
MSVETHIDERIADLLLGDVSDGERETLEAHVAGCARCNQELMHAADAFAALALALPAEPPPPSLRERLLAEARPPRLAAMLDKLAACFDITKAKARALLDRLDDPAAWNPGPVPSSWVMLSDERGPKLAGAALVGFVKMGPGVRWPAHKHLGLEHMLVLEGGFRQDDGVEVHPGQLHVMVAGSEHGFTIFDDETCISAAIVWGGVEFEDDSVSLGPVTK